MLALRKIMHGVDAYSRRLFREYKVTGPQLMCLYAIIENGQVTSSSLSKKLKLSASTLNGILDRLEQNGFIKRERNDPDRRKVTITATEKGVEITNNAPLPLQDRLVEAIKELPELEQAAIALSLERVAILMGLEDYENKVVQAKDTVISNPNQGQII